MCGWSIFSLNFRQSNKSCVLIVELWGVMVLSAPPKASSCPAYSTHHPSLSLSLSVSLLLSMPPAQMRTGLHRRCQHLIGWAITGVDVSRSERGRGREKESVQQERRCNSCVTASQHWADGCETRRHIHHHLTEPPLQCGGLKLPPSWKVKKNNRS